MLNITDRILAEGINQNLAQRGRSLDGRPIWRVSWGPDQREKKVGEFTDFNGHIIIRVVKEMREVQKYPFAPPTWVLERLTFLDSKAMQIAQKELVEIRNGSYEAVHFFMDGQCNPLPLAWAVVEHILYMLWNGPNAKNPKYSREEALDKQNQQEVLELEQQFGEIGRSDTFNREIPSIVLPSNKQDYWSRPLPVKVPENMRSI